MRGLRSLIVLVVILAGLAGYVYFLDRENEPGADGREKAFADVSADAIEEVQIKTADGETSRLQKSGDEWQLVEPVQAEADQGEVSSIASNLASVDIQRVVDENASDLAQYGLDPPRIEVGFRPKGETETRRLLLGEKTPAGGDLYARVPTEPRVFLVSSFLESTFNKNAFALRDKRILKVERDKVDGLELASGSTVLHFAKGGSDWRIVKPFVARADYGAVESAVERLASAQMQGIVAPDGGDPKQYGLDRPSATMAVSAGSSRAALTLGRTENALVFAKDSARPMIFTVAPTLQTDVVKDASEYRRKDLFDARSFTINRIEFNRGGEALAFEKTRADDNDVWKDAAGKDVDSTKVEDLLTQVSGLRAQSFDATAHPALKSPLMTVAVRFDTDKTETVTFARTSNEVVAARADEPGSATLEPSSFDEVTTALDALK